MVSEAREDAGLLPLTMIVVGGFMVALLLGAVFSFSAPTQFTLLGGLVFGVVFFTRPAFGLLMTIALRIVIEVMGSIQGGIGGLNFAEATSGSMAAAVALLFVLNLGSYRDHPAFPLFLLYSSLLSIGFVRAVAPRAGLELLVTYASPFCLMFVLCAYFKDRFTIRRVLLVTTFASVVPVMLSTYHFASGQMAGFQLSGLHRLLGGYRTLHGAAHAMMLFTSLGMYWFFHARRTSWRLLALVYTFLAFSALYLTYVRTAMIALIILVLVFLLLERRFSLLAVVGVIVVGWLVTSAVAQARFMDIVSFMNVDPLMADYEELGSGRVGLWSVSSQEFLKKPIWDLMMGLGLGHHWALQRPFFNLMVFESTNPYGYDTHSDYLAILYQMGPLAIFAYLGLQIQVLRYSWKVRQLTRDDWTRSFTSYVIAVTMAPFLTNSISNSFNSRVSPAWYLWSLAGMIFVLHRSLINGEENSPIEVTATEEEPMTESESFSSAPDRQPA